MQTLVCQPGPAPALFSPAGLVGIIFLITLALVIAGALIAVNSKRLVRSVAGLAVSFTGLAGVYYFLLSPFLAMMQMLIYVGAVAVMIAFGIMMATPEDEQEAGSKGIARLAGPVAFGVAALIFAGLTVLGIKTHWPVAVHHSITPIKDMGMALLTTHGFVFEIISVVLFLAIIGALVLAQRGRD